MIIVGAGLSGLAAAKELIYLGHSVLILEANDRIGGRGYVGQIAVGEIDASKVPIDYGGAWIHGVATNPLTPLVDGMGFLRTRTELDVPYYVNGHRASEEQTKLFHEAIEEFEEAADLAAAAEESEHGLAQYACSAASKITCPAMFKRFQNGPCGILWRCLSPIVSASAPHEQIHPQ